MRLLCHSVPFSATGSAGSESGGVYSCLPFVGEREREEVRERERRRNKEGDRERRREWERRWER